MQRVLLRTVLLTKHSLEVTLQQISLEAQPSTLGNSFD
jgi:hypothetical protein